MVNGDPGSKATAGRAKGLSPTATRVLVLVLIIGALLLSYFFYSIAPRAVTSSIWYWPSFIVWIVLARLALPEEEIHGRRRGSPPRIGYLGLALALLALVVITAATGGDRSPFAPLLAGFAGFFAGAGLLTAYEFSVNARLRICNRCKDLMWFFRDGDSFCCWKCGSKMDGSEPPEAKA